MEGSDAIFSVTQPGGRGWVDGSKLLSMGLLLESQHLVISILVSGVKVLCTVHVFI